MNSRCDIFRGILSLLIAGVFRARGDALTDKLEVERTNLVQQLSVPIEHWRFHQPDIPGAQRRDFDDRSWQEVTPGFSWKGENTKAWFRGMASIPPTVSGQSTEGLPVRLDLGMDDDGELYLDGQPHPPTKPVPALVVENVGGKRNLVVSALKHSEDGEGIILRFYESDGMDTQARIKCEHPMRVEETDLLERPLTKHPLTVEGNSVTLPVGHNQIITLRLSPSS